VKRLALLALFFLVGCGSLGSSQTHNLSLAYKAADSYKYTLHATINYTVGAEGLSIPFKLDMSGKETVTVKSVDSNGIADLAVNLTDLTVKTTTNGVTNTTLPTEAASVEMKVAADGHIVSVNGSAFGSGSLPGITNTQGGLLSAILPDKPVKAGDTWTKDFDQTNPTGTGSIHATSNSKYLRDEKVGSVDAAVVQSKITSNLDLTFDLSALASQGGTSLFPSTGNANALKGITMKGTTTSDVTSWIDSNARRIAQTKSTGDIDATMSFDLAPGTTLPGFTGPISIKGTQSGDMTPA